MNFLPQKFWNPQAQEWMSFEEAEYLRMLRLDQQLTVRETPAHEIESRIVDYRRKVSGL